MSASQPGILEPVPALARYLEFGVRPGGDPVPSLRALASRPVGTDVVAGLGAGLIGSLGKSIDGARPFPALGGPGCAVPSTQADLWFWIRGDDRGEITHLSRALTWTAGSAFRCDRLVDGFRYGAGLDLTGYEDGTENPEGDAAVAAAILDGVGPGLDGASFAAVQQWAHDLDGFAARPQDERDDIIGRRLSDNEELDDAPESAHVKRTAQESFDPEAFVLRRSMPWADAAGEGLMFVAFGRSPDAFEAQLGRMTGQEDGIVDGLFRFTRPVSGSYFWCPPVRDGHLDLSALGI
jgi:putative iron-dependent peroxidase